MSFQLPSRVPAFDSAQREIEDGYWKASQRGYTSGGGGAGSNAHGFDFTEKISSFVNPSRDLPMYKDKPYFNPRKPARGRRRWGVWILIFTIFALCIWWFWGERGPDGVGLRPRIKPMHGGELWNWVKSFDKEGKKQNSNKNVVNWEERRERVRDAFLVSWEAYEKDAWGKLREPVPIFKLCVARHSCI